MAIATSTLAAIGLAGALGYNARRGAQKGPTIPAPPAIPEEPVTPDPTRAYSEAIKRQRRKATMGSQGRTSTLLTGPQGLASTAPTERKTLLGS